MYNKGRAKSNFKRGEGKPKREGAGGRKPFGEDRDAKPKRFGAKDDFKPKKSYSERGDFKKKEGDSREKPKRYGEKDDFKPRTSRAEKGDFRKRDDDAFVKPKRYGEKDDFKPRKSYADKTEGDFKTRKSFSDRGDFKKRDDSTAKTKRYGDKTESDFKPRKSFSDKGDFKKRSDSPVKSKRFDEKEDFKPRKAYADKSESDFKPRKSFSDRGDFKKRSDSPVKSKRFDEKEDFKPRKAFDDKRERDAKPRKSFSDKGVFKKKETGSDLKSRKFNDKGAVRTSAKSFSDKGYFKKKDERIEKKEYNRNTPDAEKNITRKTKGDALKDNINEKEEFFSFQKYEDDKKNFKEGKKKYLDLTKEKKSKSFASQKEDDGKLRLNKFLSNAGICSRREADQLIESGVISVNGKVVTELGTRVNADDKISYGDQTVKTEATVYLLLNKPKDYITTVDDPQKRRTVMELIHGACKERVYPVGRLDRNTTGLLLFTNDGEMTIKLTHPKNNIRKVYHVVTDQNVSREDMEKMRNGIQLEDGFIMPDDVEFVGEGHNKKDIGVEIHSGKNRVVRRMFEHLGYKVIKLDRVMFAGLTKKDLPRGRWRLLTKNEISFLKMG